VVAMRTQPEHGLSGWRPTRTGMTGPGVQAGLLPSSGLNTTEPGYFPSWMSRLPVSIAPLNPNPEV